MFSHWPRLYLALILAVRSGCQICQAIGPDHIQLQYQPLGLVVIYSAIGPNHILVHELYSPNDDQSIFNVLISILQFKLLKSRDLKEITTFKNQHTDPTVAPGLGPRTFSPRYFFHQECCPRIFQSQMFPPQYSLSYFPTRILPQNCAPELFTIADVSGPFPSRFFHQNFPLRTRGCPHFDPLGLCPHSGQRCPQYQVRLGQCPPMPENESLYLL